MNKKFCGYGCGLWFNCFYGNKKKKMKKTTKNQRKQQIKKSKENYNKTRKFSKRTSNRKPYALGQGKI